MDAVEQLHARNPHAWKSTELDSALLSDNRGHALEWVAWWDANAESIERQKERERSLVVHCNEAKDVAAEMIVQEEARERWQSSH